MDDMLEWGRNVLANVECAFHQNRLTHLPIETRGCAAVWDEGRQHLTLHIGNQVPHPLRTQVAARMRLSESQVDRRFAGCRRRLRPEDRALP